MLKAPGGQPGGLAQVMAVWSTRSYTRGALSSMHSGDRLVYDTWHAAKLPGAIWYSARLK